MEEKLTSTPMAPHSLAALVLEAQKGDADAFTRLAEENQRTLFRVAYTVLGHDGECADAVQEALSKAWLKLGALREPGYFRTWLIRILLNECYRIKKRRKRMWEPVAACESRSAERLNDDIIDLKAAMTSLPEEQRLALALYHVEDMSVAEIAKLLRLPQGTVKSRLARARARLAESMKA